MAIRKNPFRKNQHSLADANAMRKPVKPMKQASHNVETVAKMAGDSHREVSPKPSTSVAGDRTHVPTSGKPKRGIRRTFDDYGEAASRDPWEVIRVRGEARAAEMKAAILAKHEKGPKGK